MGTVCPSVDKVLVTSELVTEIGRFYTDIAAYRTALSAHVHGGTDGVGAADSAAGPAAISLTCAAIPNVRQLSDAQALEAVREQLNLLRTDIGSFFTQFTAHTHGSVTAGGADSGAAATVAATIAALTGSYANVGWRNWIETMVYQYNKLYTQLATLNTAMGAHTHKVNAGVATSSAIAALAARTAETLVLAAA